MSAIKSVRNLEAAELNVLNVAKDLDNFFKYLKNNNGTSRNTITNYLIKIKRIFEGTKFLLEDISTINSDWVKNEKLILEEKLFKLDNISFTYEKNSNPIVQQEIQRVKNRIKKNENFFLNDEIQKIQDIFKKTSINLVRLEALVKTISKESKAAFTEFESFKIKNGKVVVPFMKLYQNEIMMSSPVSSFFTAMRQKYLT